MKAYPQDPELQKLHDEYMDALAEHKRRSSEIYNSGPYTREMGEKLTALHDEIITPKRRSYTNLSYLKLMGIKIIPREKKG